MLPPSLIPHHCLISINRTFNFLMGGNVPLTGHTTIDIFYSLHRTTALANGAPKGVRNSTIEKQRRTGL